jgi:hypothetical protein
MGENAMNASAQTAVFGAFASASCQRAPNNVVAMQNFGAGAIVQQPIRVWRSAIVERLDELCQLPVGWDGYHAGPVTFTNASFALSMLESTCGVDAPAPQIVPGADGDLQVEWHAPRGDIELHVRGPFNVHAWRMRHGANDGGEEMTLSNDFTAVANWVKELAEPLIAPGTAAA